MSRIDAAILGLAVAPHPPGSKKLQGTGDFYRIRIGDYRVVYQVENERLVVVVVNVAHRRDIYRNRSAPVNAWKRSLSVSDDSPGDPL